MGGYYEGARVQGSGLAGRTGVPFRFTLSARQDGNFGEEKREERGQDAAMIYADDFALSITRVAPCAAGRRRSRSSRNGEQ
jgi:hypothetical protein